MTMINQSMAMTPEQIAAETSLHINTVYSYIKSGRIPHVKLSRRYLVSRVEFEKFLSGNQPQARRAAGITGENGTTDNGQGR